MPTFLDKPQPAPRPGAPSPARRRIHRLAIAALLVALSIMLTRFFGFVAIGSGVFRLELGHVPLLLAGLLLGPLMGGLSGLAADLAGVLVLSQGTFHPGFTISSVLTGLLPGLAALGMAHLSRPAGARTRLLLLASLATMADWIVSQFLTTVWISMLYGMSWQASFVTRIVPVLLRTLLNGMLLAVLLRVLAGRRELAAALRPRQRPADLG